VAHHPAAAAPANRRPALALLALLAADCSGFEGDVLIAPEAACAESAQTILLLDRDGRLASYDPRAHLLRERASVAASVSPAGCALGKVSLALDRQGAAWIATCEGDLLRCDPDSGICAGRRASTVILGSVHMAWASEPGGAQALFLAVPPSRVPLSSPPLRSSLLRFPDLEEPMATLAGWPTLTGTVDRLWGLFPGQPGRDGTPPRLVTLDPTSGREVESRELAGVVLEPTPVWLAAASGDLWVFQATGPATRVLRIGVSGRLGDTPRSIPRSVVGAASSTCSP
jgi:hypothetical protein